jgi:hypothetical protein
MTNESHLRVLVALDSSDPNEDVLRIVSRLMGAHGLDVTGLYVEDEDLLRAASIPGLREISLSGQETILDAGRVARDIACEGAAARRAFEALTQQLAREHLRLRHRFLVTRGRIAEEFDRAARESDFVMVTRALRATALRPRLGRCFTQLVQQPKDVLFVNEPWASGSSVVVLLGSDRALDHATRLARTEGLRLVVATTARPAAPPVDQLPPGATVRQLADWDEETIADLCLEQDARLLVMPQLRDLDWAELLVSLMDKLPCSLLKLTDP